MPSCEGAPLLPCPPRRSVRPRSAASSRRCPASAATGCSVAYAVSSQWPGGFGANVTVKNLGDPVSAWTLVWSYSGRAAGDPGVERHRDPERRAGHREERRLQRLARRPTRARRSASTHRGTTAATRRRRASPSTAPPAPAACPAPPQPDPDPAAPSPPTVHPATDHPPASRRTRSGSAPGRGTPGPTTATPSYNDVWGSGAGTADDLGAHRHQLGRHRQPPDDLAA